MKSIIELTVIARDHAVRNDLLQQLEKLSLDIWVVAGDIICVGNSPAERFIVSERRIDLAKDGAQCLCFILDFPARSRR